MFKKINLKNILISLIRFSRFFNKKCIERYMKLNNISEDSFLDFRDFQYALEQLETIDFSNRELVEGSILSLTTLCKVSEAELKAACENLTYSYDDAKLYGYSYDKSVREKSGYVHILSNSDRTSRLAVNATTQFNNLHF